jgi:hypothetical protein
MVGRDLGQVLEVTLDGIRRSRPGLSVIQPYIKVTLGESGQMHVYSEIIIINYYCSSYVRVSFVKSSPQSGTGAGAKEWLAVI